MESERLRSRSRLRLNLIGLLEPLIPKNAMLENFEIEIRAYQPKQNLVSEILL